MIFLRFKKKKKDIVLYTFVKNGVHFFMNHGIEKIGVMRTYFW